MDFDRVFQPLVWLRRMVQQRQNFLRVFLRKADDRLAFNHALGFHIGGLHDELIDRRAQKLRRLFQRVAHTVRDPGRDPLAWFVQNLFHACMVPLCHRLVNPFQAFPACRR